MCLFKMQIHEGNMGAIYKLNFIIIIRSCFCFVFLEILLWFGNISEKAIKKQIFG